MPIEILPADGRIVRVLIGLDPRTLGDILAVPGTADAGLALDRADFPLLRPDRHAKGFDHPTGSATQAINGVEVNAADLMMIRDGVDLVSVWRQLRFERQPA